MRHETRLKMLLLHPGLLLLLYLLLECCHGSVDLVLTHMTLVLCSTMSGGHWSGTPGRGQRSVQLGHDVVSVWRCVVTGVTRGS